MAVAREEGRDHRKERRGRRPEAEWKPAEVPAVEGELTRAGRLRSAVRERLPLWWQTRCGLNFKALAALAVVLVLGVGLALHHLWSGRAEPVSPPSSLGTESEVAGAEGTAVLPSPPVASAGAGGGAAATSTGKPLFIDVSGDVRKPGVHQLPPGSRVEDAIEAAGGVTSGASDEGLNRARLVVDGERIVVGQESAADQGAEGGQGVGPPRAETGGGGAGTGEAGAGGVVSLNSATVEQLQTLPGIGPVLAQQIVEFRTNQGGFSSVEQLREVNGIGDHRFTTLRPLVGP